MSESIQAVSGRISDVLFVRGHNGKWYPADVDHASGKKAWQQKLGA